MAVHVAILKACYLKLVLSGRKTIESRLTLTRQPPFGRVEPGDRLFFKQSGGPFHATAIARQVASYAHVTPEQVQGFEATLNDRICGSPDYWQQKQACRFATFVHLRDVELIDVGPDYGPAHMRAWFTLDPSQNVLMDVVWTEASIRNRLVRVKANHHHFAPGPATLILPDGCVCETKINTRGHVGGRRWQTLCHAYRVVPGDAVRLIALGDRRYRVSFIKHHAHDD